MLAQELSIVWLTLRTAAAATLLVLPFGVAAGWLLAGYRGRGRTLLETAFLLPLVLPPSAVGLLLLELLSPRWPLGRLLALLHLEVAFTWWAAVLAGATMAFPLLLRAARTAFEGVEPRLPQLARTLGYGRLGAFARVTLPLAGRGILAGTLLAFGRALGELGATLLVAGNIPGETQTLALAIFERAQVGDDKAALRMVAATVVLAVLAVWGAEALGRARSHS